MNAITSDTPVEPKGFIIGHSNMDLDCLASLVLAQYLYPGFRALRSNRIHPLARNLYNMYEEHLAFGTTADLNPQSCEHLVVVDTRSPHQIKEFLDILPHFSGKITVFDHHGNDDPSLLTSVENNYLAHAEQHHEHLGANASLMCKMLMERGTTVGQEDATIALAGIYADTGNFTHANVKPADFEAARWLLEQGANITLVRKFVTTLHSQELGHLMHELLSRLETFEVNNQLILLAQIELEHQPSGLAIIVERLFDLEHADAIFCVFVLKKEKSHLIVARSSASGADVAFLLSQFGGGGHPQSASALLKKSDGIPVMDHLKQALRLRLKPPPAAKCIMKSPVDCVQESWSLLDASLFLETHNRTGAPVLDHNGLLCGMFTLRDIQRGRKAGRMNNPVKAWMTHDPIVLSPDAPLREVEELFFATDLRHLPVVSNGQVLGLISRNDYLAILRGDQQAPSN